jgi:hypothetical protein
MVWFGRFSLLVGVVLLGVAISHGDVLVALGAWFSVFGLAVGLDVLRQKVDSIDTFGPSYPHSRDRKEF